MKQTKNKLRVTAALDSFKGALTSIEAGDAVRRGILSRVPDADVSVFSVGDGGEGTADALICGLGAERKTLRVHDTHGTLINAKYGITPDGKTAVLDMASAASIRFAASHGFDIHNSSTYGVGEMIASLADCGCEHIIVGLGGSGTSDGGIGALSALGALFFDEKGSEILPCNTSSAGKVFSCDLAPAVMRVKNTAITLLYDTAVALTGESGAVKLYSRQKGAHEDELDALDEAMIRFATVCDSAVGKQVSLYPGAGAAGGLGYGLSLIGGKLTAGAEFVLDAVGYTENVKHADLVITGEGKTDCQTATGKLPMTVALKAGGKPVICLCGVSDPVPELYKSGITSVFALADRPMTADESIAQTAKLLEKAAYNIAGLFI